MLASRFNRELNRVRTINGTWPDRLQGAPNREQILAYHNRISTIDLGDAKYDERHNYEFSRSQGAILSEA